ncbi:TPA: hypothetical protein ACW7X5_003522, partial [Elizabethkingia meningoseptica]
GTNITSGVSNASFDYGSVAPAKGTSYNFRITLKTTGDVAGNEWALGNLWYDKNETDERFRYKFRPDDTTSRSGSTYRDTDYWGWGSELPGTASATSPSTFVDPCSRVYPAGTWRMPTRANFQALIRLTPTSTPDTGTILPSLNNPNGTAYYIQTGNLSYQAMKFRDTPAEKKWVQFTYDSNYRLDPNYVGVSGGKFWTSNLYTSNSAYYASFGGIALYTGSSFFLTNNYLLNIRCVKSK